MKRPAAASTRPAAVASKRPASAASDTQPSTAAPKTVQTVRSPYVLRLRQERALYLQQQAEAVAELPTRHVWALRGDGNAQSHLRVPLKVGLGSDVLEVPVETKLHPDGLTTVSVSALKNAIASQVCGNSFVFDICYDPISGPASVGEGESAKLLDMEQLQLHLCPVDARDNLVSNLTILYCGEARSFETHDNGGRPFKVEITCNRATILANYNPADEDEGIFADGEAPLIAEFQSCEKIFVGVSSGSAWCDHPVTWEERFGSSVLLCLDVKSEVVVGSHAPTLEVDYRRRLEKLFEDTSEDRHAYCFKLAHDETLRGRFTGPGRSYVFVGHEIYIFQLPDDDEIVEYYSMIGRNDVPYPVAVGRKYLYFMLDQQYAPRPAINEKVWLYDTEHVDEVDGPRWEDAYRWFYFQAKEVAMQNFPGVLSLGERM